MQAIIRHLLSAFSCIDALHDIFALGINRRNNLPGETLTHAW